MLSTTALKQSSQPQTLPRELRPRILQDTGGEDRADVVRPAFLYYACFAVLLLLKMISTKRLVRLG